MWSMDRAGAGQSKDRAEAEHGQSNKCTAGAGPDQEQTRGRARTEQGQSRHRARAEQSLLQIHAKTMKTCKTDPPTDLGRACYINGKGAPSPLPSYLRHRPMASPPTRRTVRLRFAAMRALCTLHRFSSSCERVWLGHVVPIQCAPWGRGRCFIAIHRGSERLDGHNRNETSPPRSALNPYDSQHPSNYTTDRGLHTHAGPNRYQK